MAFFGQIWGKNGIFGVKCEEKWWFLVKSCGKKWGFWVKCEEKWQFYVKFGVKWGFWGEM